MEPEEIEEASKFAKDFMDQLTGRKLDIVAAANVITLEFITRHTHFTVDDIVESVEFLTRFNDKRKDTGHITTAKVADGIN